MCIMGRHRTRLNLAPAQLRGIRQLHQTTRDDRVKERLRFALLAATGRETLEGLAERLGRSRSTIQNWLGKLEHGGLAALLDRDTPPGMVSPVASRAIQAQLKAGVKSGQWRSAAEIAAWLKREHGVERSRKSIYYWIHKLGSPSRLRKSKPPMPAQGGRRKL